MKLVFLGSPGSGKGTIAKIISKKLGYYHLSTGDLFRENISKATPLGIEVKNIVESGKLVPDSITIKIVEDKFHQIDPKKGFILDGFPRNIPQAKKLDKIIADVMIINFVIDEEKLIKRLSGRRICNNCGSIYNIYTLPPKIEEVCDVCGGALYQRKDDMEDSLKIRLKEYKVQTKPLINYYLKDNRLNNINASLEVYEVEKKLIEIIQQ